MAEKVTNALWGFREAVERKESRKRLFTNEEPSDAPPIQQAPPMASPGPMDFESPQTINSGQEESPLDSSSVTAEEGNSPFSNAPKGSEIETPGPLSAAAGSPERESGEENIQVKFTFQSNSQPVEDRPSPFGDGPIVGDPEPITPFGEPVSREAITESLFSEPDSPAEDRQPSLFGERPEPSPTASPFEMGGPAPDSPADPLRGEDSEKPSSLFGKKVVEATPAENHPEHIAAEPRSEEPPRSKDTVRTARPENPFHRPEPPPVVGPAEPIRNDPAENSKPRVDSTRPSLFTNENPDATGLQSGTFAKSEQEPVPSPSGVVLKNPFEPDSPTAPVNPISLTPKSFMDGPSDEADPLDNPPPLAVSTASEVTIQPSRETNPNYSTLSLKPDKRRQQSLSTEMLLIILFVTSVLMGFAAFSITPKEKREEMRIKLGEWLEPTSVVIEQVPFIPHRETEIPESPPPSGELRLEFPVQGIPSPAGTDGVIPEP